jgi:hypothetical protein
VHPPRVACLAYGSHVKWGLIGPTTKRRKCFFSASQVGTIDL